MLELSLIGVGSSFCVFDHQFLYLWAIFAVRDQTVSFYIASVVLSHWLQSFIQTQEQYECWSPCTYSLNEQGSHSKMWFRQKSSMIGTCNWRQITYCLTSQHLRMPTDTDNLCHFICRSSIINSPSYRSSCLLFCVMICAVSLHLLARVLLSDFCHNTMLF